MQRVRYVVDLTTGCWVWQMFVTKYGYGWVNDGRPRHAHIVEFEKVHGPVPEGMMLDHLCRNRRCVNPDHLQAVTGTENVRRGNACKLSTLDVETIRSEFASGALQKDIAMRFNLHPAAVSKIVNGHSWVSEISDPQITRRTKSSRFKGVTFNKNAGRWIAFVSIKRKYKYLGLHDSEAEAAQAVANFQLK